MIAIKNADGTLVPVMDSFPGNRQSVALSLVHSQQRRAEIQVYDVDPTQESSLQLRAGQKPFGVLVLKKLPENPFGEVEINAELSIDDKGRLHIVAEAEGIKPVSGEYRLPRQPHEQSSAARLSAPSLIVAPEGDGPEYEFEEADASAAGRGAQEAEPDPFAFLDEALGLAPLDEAASAAPAEAGLEAEPELDDFPDTDSLFGDAAPAEAGLEAEPGLDDFPDTDNLFGDAAPAEAGLEAEPELDDFPDTDSLFGDAAPAEAGPDLALETADDPFELGALGLEPEAVPEADEGSQGLPEAALAVDGQGFEAAGDENFDEDWLADVPGLEAGFEEATPSTGLETETAAPKPVPGSFGEPGDAEGALPDFGFDDLDQDGAGLQLSDQEADVEFGLADLGSTPSGGAGVAPQGPAELAEASAHSSTSFIDDPDDTDWGFDELAETPAAPVPGPEARGSSGPGARASQKPSRPGPKPKAGRDRRAGSRMPGLMVASIALFGLSVVELAAYLVIRFNIAP